MKLVRMVTTDPTATFNNYFNDELVLPVNGKIGLQNISIDKDSTEIEINGDNDTITYSIIPNIERSIQLVHQSYTDNNYSNLFTDMTNKFNNSSTFEEGAATSENRVLGTEWKVELGTNNKVSIGFDSSPHGEYSIDWELNQITRTSTYYNMTNSLPPTDTNSSFMGFTEYIATGCGYARTRIGNIAAISTGNIEKDGYIIGLTTTDISGKPKTITNAEMTYAIHIPYDTSPYRVAKDGVFVNSATTVSYISANNANNDVIELMINGDQIQYNVYVAGSTTPIALGSSYNYTAGQKLYPFMIFRSDSTRASVAGTRLTPSPYATVADSEPSELGSPPSRQNNLYEVSLTFGNVSLSKYLGYQNLRYPTTGDTDSYDKYFWIAENIFDAVDVADSFIVELLDIPLDSYDGLKQQRKNILAVIPKSDAGGYLIYEPNTPYFIDIRNTKAILLRNIRARILKSDYSEYNMRGLATLTILIS